MRNMIHPFIVIMINYPSRDLHMIIIHHHVHGLIIHTSCHRQSMTIVKIMIFQEKIPDWPHHMINTWYPDVLLGLQWYIHSVTCLYEYQLTLCLTVDLFNLNMTLHEIHIIITLIYLDDLSGHIMIDLNLLA